MYEFDIQSDQSPTTLTSGTFTLNPALTPGLLHVMRRDNKSIVQFKSEKIAIAITKAYLAVEGGNAAASTRVHETVAKLTQRVVEALSRRIEGVGVVHVEDIQDQVELVLMRDGLQKVARSYVLYREERRRLREKRHTPAQPHPSINVTHEDGHRAPLDLQWLNHVITSACADLSAVDPLLIADDTLRSLFDGVKINDVRKAMVMSVRTRIEMEPNYSFVAARLLLDELQNEALPFLGLPTCQSFAEMNDQYPSALSAFIHRGIDLGILNAALAEFDLEALGRAIRPEQDLQFTYLGLQTLYDRYFIHSNDTRYELPQVFFMRIAMGLALEEKNKTERTIEFYNLISSFDYMCSTPTLFNSGTVRSQLSSCYLSTVPDDLSGIYNAIRDNALLSKFAGGLGNDWTPVRALGAHILGTNGKSQGVVPFLKVANDTAVAVNQGGKRKGALCSYLETWHMDIEEFLELRKNTGDDRRRTHDMNTANWIPDLFMKRVFEDKDWTLFSPEEVPELHDLFGDAFTEKYEDYEAKALDGKIRNFKTVRALGLWRKILSMVFETGHPWITFKDVCNLRSPQQHVGVVHSSNLCTEITLNTSIDEIAVCNLGSVNLAAHMNGETIDAVKLKKTITTAIRMLDNVIDINYYAVPQARASNLKHRPIGLGTMGFQDALYLADIAYASDEAVTFADNVMEMVSYFAIEASMELAQERGTYQSFDGSLWSKGILPIDSISFLKDARGPYYLEMDESMAMDWTALRENVRKHGVRNSNLMAIAPTATISNICGVTQSIEPTYQNLFVKSNLSGEFTVVNPFLVDDLKALNLWDQVLVNDLKYYNGSVQKIDRIPAHLKLKYATAFEIEPRWLIEAGSRRQKWIDQAQSLNLYFAKPSGKVLDSTYRLAWLRGLKTTYYARSLGATDTEKSTIHDGALNAVSSAPQACAIDDPTCEACQ